MFAAGPADEDGLAPELRKGLLWDECRKFAAAGWVVDTNGYCTAFRVTLKVRLLVQLKLHCIATSSNVFFALYS